MQISYSVWDPMANITVLVTSSVDPTARPFISKHLIETIEGAEQVGYLEIKTDSTSCLNMTGGEFCGNAAMSVAAMIAGRYDSISDKGIEIVLSVSGASDPVSVYVENGTETDSYICTVTMPLPATVEIFDTVLDDAPVSIPLVRLPGIAHFVVQNSISPEETAEIEDLLRKLAQKVESDAYGMIFIGEAEMPILPLLYVPAADTMIWENACGSGSAAVAAWLAAQHGDPVAIRLKQPGGDSILARAKVTMTAPGEVGVSFLSITGSVKLREYATIEIDI